MVSSSSGISVQSLHLVRMQTMLLIIILEALLLCCSQSKKHYSFMLKRDPSDFLTITSNPWVSGDLCSCRLRRQRSSSGKLSSCQGYQCILSYGFCLLILKFLSTFFDHRNCSHEPLSSFNACKFRVIDALACQKRHVGGTQTFMKWSNNASSLGCLTFTPIRDIWISTFLFL